MESVWLDESPTKIKFQGDDLTGKRFGRLTVLCIKYNLSRKHYEWECLCDCGNITHASTWQLKTDRRNGKKSCGCLARDILISRSTTHGQSHNLLYITWRNIKTRCCNPNYELFHRYGGRGIKLCEEWYDFENFYEWSMNNGYEPGLSIDRIDNDMGYSPANCRWTTPKEQARNTSRSKIIEYKGQLKTVAEWAEEYGIKYSVLNGRLSRGWSMEDAIRTPIRYSAS